MPSGSSSLTQLQRTARDVDRRSRSIAGNYLHDSHRPTTASLTLVEHRFLVALRREHQIVDCVLQIPPEEDVAERGFQPVTFKDSTTSAEMKKFKVYVESFKKYAAEYNLARPASAEAVRRNPIIPVTRSRFAVLSDGSEWDSFWHSRRPQLPR
jgi:hypothetical protein